ncbi:MAG TPA: hypothetical protein VHJ34_00725 [Actinomycetota bacterium]|nr:hypothetical protein [Actinomycetota bacterium]
MSPITRLADRRARCGDERGFTLVDLLVTMAITAALLSLGASAVRHFWLVRTLEGAADDVRSGMRALHEQATSESHPLVYGARFRVGSNEWYLFQYNPNAATASGWSCTDRTPREGTFQFDGGVRLTAASFTLDAAGATIRTRCASALPGAAASDHYALFYARGDATPGSVTVTQPALAGRTRTVEVLGLTGRVEERT